MYTLRIIDKEGISNHELGEGYGTVSLFGNYENFAKCFKEMFNREFPHPQEESADTPKFKPYSPEANIIGFVRGTNDHNFPIYEYDTHYIMTENGKTFDNINRLLTRKRVVN